MRVAIIGSAGRKTDAANVSATTFAWIVQQCLEDTTAEDELISGGAAFSDHAAVIVALQRGNHLLLELPAPWDHVAKRYVSTEAGRISNYYHYQFSRACGWPESKSLEELDAVISLPSTQIKQANGFFERNSWIADTCDRLIAFTFHEPGATGPSGGTGNTWRKCPKPKRCIVIPTSAVAAVAAVATPASGPAPTLEWPKPSAALMEKVNDEYSKGIVYPPRDQILAALDLCPLNKVKVVILGQDCYHVPNQAHGLAFSVVKPPLPPSLRNIFAELKDDLGIDRSQDPSQCNLSDWAAQGVLLLNSMLTVRAGQAASHAQLGWQEYTDELIELVNQQPKVVFILWGGFAKKKTKIIHVRHKILISGHPSPLSVQLFRGCKHFSKANAWLVEHDMEPIQW